MSPENKSMTPEEALEEVRKEFLEYLAGIKGPQKPSDEFNRKWNFENHSFFYGRRISNDSNAS